MKLLLTLFALTCAIQAHAVQKYNPYTKKHETVPEGSKLKYNPYTKQHSYQPNGSKLEYNPYNRNHEWDSGHN